MHPRSKIPNQARFLKIDRAEFHFRPKLIGRLGKELRGRKKTRRCGRDEKRDDEVDRGGDDRASFQKLAMIDQVAREKKRE